MVVGRHVAVEIADVTSNVTSHVAVDVATDVPGEARRRNRGRCPGAYRCPGRGRRARRASRQTGAPGPCHRPRQNRKIDGLQHNAPPFNTPQRVVFPEEDFARPGRILGCPPRQTGPKGPNRCSRWQPRIQCNHSSPYPDVHTPRRYGRLAGFPDRARSSGCGASGEGRGEPGQPSQPLTPCPSPKGSGEFMEGTFGGHGERRPQEVHSQP